MTTAHTSTAATLSFSTARQPGAAARLGSFAMAAAITGLLLSSLGHIANAQMVDAQQMAQAACGQAPQVVLITGKRLPRA